MFFLSGFSSILPYILYLFVVWACLMVGMHNLSSRFNIHRELFSFRKAELNFTHDQKILEQYVSVFELRDEIRSEATQPFANLTPEEFSCDINSKQIFRKSSNSTLISSPGISSYSRRGPPLS